MLKVQGQGREDGAEVNHTHEYKFWHSHEHRLGKTLHEGLDVHNHGHYHLWAQTHDHGEKATPHSHKDKLFHPGEDNIEHHAEEVH